MKHVLCIATLTGLTPLALAGTPVQILGCETFGDDPGNDIGYSISPAAFDDTAFDFFTVLPNNQTRFAPIAGGDGTNVFAAEDIDGETPSTLGTLTTSGVDLSAKTNLFVEILLAAPGDSDAGFTSFNDNTEYDFSVVDTEIDRMIVSFAADGINFIELVRFEPNAGDFNGVVVSKISAAGTARNVTVAPGISGDAFSRVTFSPQGAPANAAVRIDFQSNGSGEFFAVDSICFYGEDAVTVPPAIANVPAATLDYAEGSGAQVIAPALTLSDPDSTNLASATVTIGAGYNAAQDVLSAVPSGAILAGNIIIVGSSLNITANASLADYQAVLQSVTYENTELTNPDTTPRQVSFSVSDGVNTSNAAIRTVEPSNVFSSQTIPFAESFETDGQGVRYLADGQLGSDGDPDIFNRAQPGIAATDGLWAFAIEDVTVAQTGTLEAIYFNLSNPDGYAKLKLNLLAAALNGSAYDTGDFIEAQVSTNGSTWTTVASFHATSDGSAPTVGSTTISLDTDLNGLGDTDSTVLTGTFQDFEFDLPDNVNFQLRIVMQSNSNNERLLVDNIRVTGELPEFSIADASASENDGSISLTVTRSTGVGTHTIDFDTADGTATAGNDFTGSGDTLTFNDGDTTKDITVTLVDDNTVELDEAFRVTLSNPSAGTIATGAGSATASIVNDDSSSVSISNPAVVEGDTGTASLQFSLALTNPVDADVVLAVATGGGTASAGTDYSPLSTTVTFSAGTTIQTATVSVTGDHEVEPDETLNLASSLNDASGRNVTGTATGTGTITDDDPEITFPPTFIGFSAGISSKLAIADLLGTATNPEGRPLSVSSLGATSLAGSSVEIVGDQIFYRPPAPGLPPAFDSFTVDVTDGFQTVTVTVQVIPNGNGTTATSSIISVTDAAPPAPAGSKLVTGLGIPGRGYGLQTSTNLIDWADVGTPQVATASGLLEFLHPGAPPSGFYRIIDPANSTN